MRITLSHEKNGLKNWEHYIQTLQKQTTIMLNYGMICIMQFSELNSEFFYNFRNCIPNFRIFAKTKQR